MKTLKISIAHCYILIVCAQSVYSQLSQMKFEHINIDQGLSQASINYICQDNDGFMWFCTEDGLNKYDGYNLTIYKHDPLNPNSLSDNFIYSILQDRDGMMWIGTNGGGLNKYDPLNETFIHYKNDPTDITSLGSDFVLNGFEDKNGILWFATTNGLSRFDKITNRFFNYRHDSSDSSGINDNVIYNLFEDSQNRFWILTAAGLNQLDRKTNHFIHYPNSPEFTISIAEETSNRIWIGTAYDGLYEFDPITNSFKKNFKSNTTLEKGYIESIYIGFGGMWLGSKDGLDKFDLLQKQIVEHYENDPQNPTSLSNNRVCQIYEDRSGAFWIGTIGGGINKVKASKKNIQSYSISVGVWSICEDQSGMIWVGTNARGLYQIDLKKNTTRIFRQDPLQSFSLSSDIVKAIYEDKKGDLWIGTHGGVNRYHDGSFVRYVHDPKTRQV